MPCVPSRVLACTGSLDFNFVHTLLSTPPPKRSFCNFAPGCAFARRVALGMEQCRFIDVAHLDGLAMLSQCVAGVGSLLAPWAGLSPCVSACELPRARN